MKTQEELNALKNEVETLNKKLAELTEDELTQVVGACRDGRKDPCPIVYAWNDMNSKHVLKGEKRTMWIFNYWNACCNLRGNKLECGNCAYYQAFQSMK